jgi:glutaredoxin-related protein
MLNDEKVMDMKRFSLLVEKRALDPQMGYMDAVIDICEQNDIEIETVNRLISKPLKEKIEAEAIELNFMKGGNTLPL